MSRGLGIGGHHSASTVTDEWLTPPWILEALGPFDLDPCAPTDRPWDIATDHYTINDDGLERKWEGFVFLNPPYSKGQAWVWLDRLATHGHGIGLTFARTEVTGFVRSIWHKADAILFLHGRLYFHHPDGTRAKANSGGPSVLVAYGGEAVERLRCAGIVGSLAHMWRQTGA